MRVNENPLKSVFSEIVSCGKNLNLLKSKRETLIAGLALTVFAYVIYILYSKVGNVTKSISKTSKLTSEDVVILFPEKIKKDLQSLLAPCPLKSLPVYEKKISLCSSEFSRSEITFPVFLGIAEDGKPYLVIKVSGTVTEEMIEDRKMSKFKIGQKLEKCIMLSYIWLVNENIISQNFNEPILHPRFSKGLFVFKDGLAKIRHLLSTGACEDSYDVKWILDGPSFKKIK